MHRSANIAVLRANLRGQVIQPGDDGYDEARALYNGMIDKRPLVIARCSDVADVISAVNFGRDNGLLIAHSGEGDQSFRRMATTCSDRWRPGWREGAAG